MDADTILGSCLKLKSFMYDGASFYMRNSQGILWEEITGLRLWRVTGRFHRDEENVGFILILYTLYILYLASILYYIPSYRKKNQY